MLRRPQQHNGLKLPPQLQQELGLSLNEASRSGRKYGRTGVGRKDRRKAERAEKKAVGVTGNARRHTKTGRAAAVEKDGSEEVEGSEEEEDEPRAPKRPITDNRSATIPAQVRKNRDDQKPKSILKRTALPAEPTPSTDDSGEERSPSPGLVLDKSSKSFQDRAAQDVAEIAALEKKLGLKSKKLPKAFDEDGLDYLLEGLDSEEETKKRKREGLDWLQGKRRRMEVEDESDESSEDDEGEEDDDSGLEADSLLEDGTDAIDSEEVDDFAGFASDEEVSEQQPVQRKRENPYVAPVPDSSKSTTKYVPPSLRKQKNPDSETLQRLRRQLQGQLNKLSEANILCIMAEVEKLYQSNARQDVTSTLIDLLLFLFCDHSILQNTFIILHASFVAALYKVIGTDFGAEFVSQLVERFERYHKPNETTNEKQGVNLVSLLAHLYTFHVIGNNLVFDHIRVLLKTLSETNAELMLRIVRDAGPQLRQDDPSSLKDIVLLMQNATAEAQANGTNISIRTKFMIETITDLKNNKLRTELAASGVASEHITRMRKTIGTLNSRNIRASEPLRIGLSDIKNADKRGKWWLVGASWKEEDKILRAEPAYGHDKADGADVHSDGEEADLVTLARQHRMNTGVRRAIFIAIMSATDYQDAHHRLRKLHLKRSQEQEIPRVVIHCAGAEGKYNPYYTLIAKALCGDKRLRMAFQFSLWDFFKRMGEKGDEAESDDEEDREEVQLKEIVNIARLFGNLIADGTMHLGILKTLNLALLKAQASMFVEVLLVVVISKSQEGRKEGQDEERLANIFAMCKDTPHVTTGLRHFLKKVVRHTDLASSKAEERLVKWGCGVAIDTLKVVSSGRAEFI